MAAKMADLTQMPLISVTANLGIPTLKSGDFQGKNMKYLKKLSQWNIGIDFECHFSIY